MSDETLATTSLISVRPQARHFRRDRRWLLVVPMTLFFLVFFAFPVLSLLAVSLDKPMPGVVTAHGDFVAHQLHPLLQPAAVLRSGRTHARDFRGLDPDRRHSRLSARHSWSPRPSIPCGARC